MASTVAAVPTLYTCFFAYADPLIALYGAYLNLLAPEQAVASMAPQSTYDPATVFLFHQAGGLALAVAVMSALVPRVSEDLAVWKVLQFSLLLSDAGGLSEGRVLCAGEAGEAGAAAVVGRRQGRRRAVLVHHGGAAGVCLGRGVWRRGGGEERRQEALTRRRGKGKAYPLRTVEVIDS
ncbi:beta-mannosidase mndA, partial [Metarhizium majus ARSEF 297]